MLICKVHISPKVCANFSVSLHLKIDSEATDALSTSSTNEAMSMSSSSLTSLVGRQCDVIFCHLEQNVVVAAPFGITGAKFVPVAP